ncbi:ion channel [Novacetimonas cocois]|uniref:ATP-sensitive potassium channel protein n=1 Tax=Novacetimonas cocois TaxID=1747507 RepID=A0A365YRL5_9PROT|nr:ion channel [Novacetimonas cocois]RBM05349.1 ATP-sensitive potassium channel protein [Novacetimonas cocois]
MPQPSRPVPAEAPAAPVLRHPHVLEDKGHDAVVRVGQADRIWSDFYHHALIAPWGVFFYWSIAFYIIINVVFALAYMAVGTQVSGARAGDFLDYFFFSVQTLSTVGYGVMAPVGRVANLLATTEVLGGMMINAVATGLVFARFSRPRARIMFSKRAVIVKNQAQPHLDVRIANCRRSPILSADIEFSLARLIPQPDGHVTRQFDSLPLRQSHMPVLRFACLPVHVIDENSPLHGVTLDMLKSEEAEIIVTITGTDEASGQTVFARTAYGFDRMLYDHHFVDIINTNPDGSITVDYTRFDQMEKQP